MKFKIGDRVIILSSGETGIIIQDKSISSFALSRRMYASLTADSLGIEYRVEYDIPKKFGIATITSSLIWEKNLELDISRMRNEKLDDLLKNSNQ